MKNYYLKKDISMKLVASLFVAIAVSVSAAVTPAWGHGIPIDMLPSAGPKLNPTPFISEASFSLIGGALLTTTLPGVNGSALSSGDEVYLKTHMGLLYYNGTDLAPTSAELLIENHDGVGITLGAATGIGQMLYWGTHNGNVGWHIHGAYTLFPAASPAGVYGLVLTASVDGYEDSDPFIVAFGHNASHDMMHAAGEAFAAQLAPVPEPATVSLLACGAAGLGVVVYRRRRAQG